MILMTKDTKEEQALEILIKIAQQFLQSLIKHCKDNDLDGATVETIQAQRVVKFDITLTETPSCSNKELEFLMQKGAGTLGKILIDLIKEKNIQRIPLTVLEDFNEMWNWRDIFKGIVNREG